MNEQEIQEILQNNPFYKDFHDEYCGHFSLVYEIGGAYVCFFNQVGGVVTSYILGKKDEKIDIELVQYFSAVGTKILQKEIKTSNL